MPVVAVRKWAGDGLVITVPNEFGDNSVNDHVWRLGVHVRLMLGEGFDVFATCGTHGHSNEFKIRVVNAIGKWVRW
jgi:hypothetical protein